MTRENRDYTRSLNRREDFRQPIRYVALDLSTSDTARLTGIRVRSMNTIDNTRKVSPRCEAAKDHTGNKIVTYLKRRGIQEGNPIRFSF